MSHEVFSLDELARHLGRDRRELEKLANRGRMPGRKIGGSWVFHQTEVTRWLEQEMKEYSNTELRGVERSQKSEEFCHLLPVSALLTIDTVQVPLEARNKRAVLESLIEVASRSTSVWSPSDLLKAVQQREEIFSTAYEGGVAIPHPRNPLPEAHSDSLIVFGRTFSGIPFGAPHGGLTDLFFMVLCRDSKAHLQIVARLGRMFQLPNFFDGLRDQEDAEGAYDYILAADRLIADQGGLH